MRLVPSRQAGYSAAVRLARLSGRRRTELTSREPIILTGSKDTNLLLGELDAQDFS